jgi:redox-sensitive bicupin YhaK (pirin superfamily)
LQLLKTGNQNSLAISTTSQVGRTLLHSEFNPSQRQELHLLQIWIIPNKQNLTPKYEQERFNLEYGKPLLLGGPDGGLVSIQQKINLYGLLLLSGTRYQHALAVANKAWIQVVKGECQVEGQLMKAGDGLGIENVRLMDIQTSSEIELLLFEIFV